LPALADSQAAREQHAEIDVAYQQALAAGPDFNRYHRGSEFRHPPRVNTDRNFLARIMFMANCIERKSYAVRGKGKHGGALGRSALMVLRVLLFVVSKKDGCLYPSLDTIGKLARMSKPTVVKAISTLVLMGFVTVYRRIKRIKTAVGRAGLELLRVRSTRRARRARLVAKVFVQHGGQHGIGLANGPLTAGWAIVRSDLPEGGGVPCRRLALARPSRVPWRA
jgi:hypothetical protein